MNNLKRFWGKTAVLLLVALVVACATPEETPELIPVASLEDGDQPADTDALDPVEEEPAEEPLLDLPPLPALEPGQVGGFGLGGGGSEAATGEAAADSFYGPGGVAEPLPIEGEFVGVNVFEETDFVLNTELPTEQPNALVQQQSVFGVDAETARQIANQFGFTGPLYTQPAYNGVERVGDSNTIENFFYAFDNEGHVLNIDGFGTYYGNNNAQYDAVPSLTLEQSASIAEAFLNERNLLPFPYEIRRGWGNEVWFMRVLDGIVVNQPEITVGLTNGGEILFVSVQRYNQLEMLGEYPLRSAQAAWEALLTGIAENSIPYNYQPIFDDAAVSIEAPFPDNGYQYWQRTFEPGQTAVIYSWPSIYLPVDGGSTPRIEAWPFAIEADATTLEAIAANPYTQFRFEGTVGENGRTLAITNWESFGDEYPETLYLQGTVIYEEGQALFVTDAGDTYVLPNAPDDIPEGELLNVFAWAAREVEGGLPILDWESLDVYIDYEDVAAEEAPELIEEPFIYEPYVYEQMNINTVDLIYTFGYIFPEFNEAESTYAPPTIVVKPVWRFAGEADNGDLLEFYVDAVAPEYLSE